MSQRSNRKDEHLNLAHDFFKANQPSDFDQMKLIRPTLPETTVSKVDLRSDLFGKTTAAPFFIEAMTGGSDKARLINQQLARLAAKHQLAMALGSASILASEPELLDSFLVARQENPTGVLIANVNPATPPKIAKKIVTELAADALQIHVNVLQELAMPEGDRDFIWLEQMQAIKDQVDVPVIVKEVGHGWDKGSLTMLKEHNFDYVDLAGAGGTNFAEIENGRNQFKKAYLNELGTSTIVSAVLAKQVDLPFFASGGVKTPLDIFKSLLLGAKQVGLANALLNVLQTAGFAALDELLSEFQADLAELFACFGIYNTSQLHIPKYFFTRDLQYTIDQYNHF